MKRVVVVACVAVMFGLASQPAAQSSAGAAFEVASVKPSNPTATGPFGGPPVPIILPLTGGRFTASNITLRDLVGHAYETFFALQIDGGPDWQTSRRFDIQARAADPIDSLDAMRPMLRALLADRFALKVHTETRDMPIYALIVARSDSRLSAKVTPSTADCSKAKQELAESSRREGPETVADRLRAGQGLPCAIMPVPGRAAGSMTMRANAVSMADLAGFLTPYTGRLVRDRTGLSGRYDWELTFAIKARTAQQTDNERSLAAPPPSDNPSLMAALEEQLGLKLESARGPVEILVIDNAALPKAD